MTCSHCVGAGEFFDSRMARSELKRYGKRGPRPTTRMMIAELVRDHGAQDADLLDIGGGIGAVQYELLAAGASRATSVDAAPAYVQTAREEAAKRGLGDRIEHIEGDFLDVAQDVAEADLVSLDRVVCCYPDADALVREAARKARSKMVLVAPKDGRWVRFLFLFPNAYLRLRHNPFRVHVHSHASLDRSAEESGLRPTGRTYRGLWSVLSYERTRP